LTAALEEIGAVEAGGADTDEDLVTAGRRWVGEIPDGEDLGAAWLGDDYGAHGVG
jgi:hypothetical protein